ncbi:MAG: hypothetical protein OQK12_18365, partial [Motiliproteus sp.]|nr:hypothetical protein [Motiliproteus sp.]
MDGFVLWRSILRAVFLAFSLSFASLAIATPVIQEVYYDLPGSDASGVFTEIYADPGLSLNDWQLVGINGSTGLPYRT